MGLARGLAGGWRLPGWFWPRVGCGACRTGGAGRYDPSPAAPCGAAPTGRCASCCCASRRPAHEPADSQSATHDKGIDAPAQFIVGRCGEHTPRPHRCSRPKVCSRARSELSSAGLVPGVPADDLRRPLSSLRRVLGPGRRSPELSECSCPLAWHSCLRAAQRSIVTDLFMASAIWPIAVAG